MAKVTKRGDELQSKKLELLEDITSTIREIYKIKGPIRDKVFAAKDCVILYWGFIQLLISFLIIRFIQFKSNIDRLKNLGFNIPIEKSLKEEKKSRDKTVRMIWIITIFCYLMLVLKVGFNYWIYSIGLTILVIDIFLLVMSRAEDNDDNDTENKAR